MTYTRDDLYKDIFVTAIEGGINYWAEITDYQWNRTDWYANFVEIDNEEDGDTTIDIYVIRKGANMLNDKKYGGIPDTVGDVYRDYLSLNNLDNSDVDATVADVIVQLGLFGKVIYG